MNMPALPTRRHGVSLSSIEYGEQVQLAKCLGDGECLENLVCLQLCNNKADETACQVFLSLS